MTRRKSATPKERLAARVLRAARKVLRIRRDIAEFDGDRRSHYEALEEAQHLLMAEALKFGDAAKRLRGKR